MKAPWSLKRRMVSCGDRPAGDLFCDKSGQDFSSRGQYLLAHDDQFRIQGLSRTRPGNRVVIRHDHAVDALAMAGLH